MSIPSQPGPPDPQHAIRQLGLPNEIANLTQPPDPEPPDPSAQLSLTLAVKHQPIPLHPSNVFRNGRGPLMKLAFLLAVPVLLALAYTMHLAIGLQPQDADPTKLDDRLFLARPDVQTRDPTHEQSHAPPRPTIRLIDPAQTSPGPLNSPQANPSGAYAFASDRVLIVDEPAAGEPCAIDEPPQTTRRRPLISFFRRRDRGDTPTFQKLRQQLRSRLQTWRDQRPRLLSLRSAPIHN